MSSVLEKTSLKIECEATMSKGEAKSPTRRKTLSRITKEQWLFASASKERYLRDKFAAAADDDGVGCFAYPSTGADFGLLRQLWVFKSYLTRNKGLLVKDK
ncbi:hypothetical protein EGR_07994 [Echinococcus granulosus]|uniref:Uncharacterized protein n=1 Tax=Echinococcus granulosus TaxID=6210 RepID=W6UGA5_ECHGR|nr:hypothetical protein EGR_07994 [Echinococcus granulosus]EUB57177.1 hypothetical protein EGR_07994 [Echinococcus granulosus]